MNNTLSKRETAAIMAGLRLLQSFGHGRTRPTWDQLSDIASNNAEFLPLTPEDIDQLAERLTFEPVNVFPPATEIAEQREGRGKPAYYSVTFHAKTIDLARKISEIVALWFFGYETVSGTFEEPIDHPVKDARWAICSGPGSTAAFRVEFIVGDQLTAQRLVNHVGSTFTDRPAQGLWKSGWTKDAEAKHAQAGKAHWIAGEENTLISVPRDKWEVIWAAVEFASRIEYTTNVRSPAGAPPVRATLIDAMDNVVEVDPVLARRMEAADEMRAALFNLLDAHLQDPIKPAADREAKELLARVK